MKRFMSAAAAAMLLLASRPLRAQDFAVVVNAANPVTSLARDQVSKIFLKKMTAWKNGEAVLPVDMPEGSRVRASFTAAVHGKSVNAVKSFWQQQIFSGRDVPPPEKTSDADVLAFVRTHPSAIGYVAAGVDLGRGVKAVPVR